MARFLVKASEYKNVCKAVNDRKLAELKKEIIEILKKQDEKEVKKAVDYFNSQELHYTHLEKSFTGKWIEKAGYGIGTVRIWKGKKYKKIAPGKWARVFEKEGRGTNIAIGKLIAKVQKIDNVEDLMAFVMQNKQRFVDENGIDLPVLDKLRAAVDARNGNVGSKTVSKLSEKKSPEKLLKEMGFETMEKVSYNGDKWEVAGVSLDSDGNAVGVNLTPDRQSGNLKSSNITVDDISKIKKEKPADYEKDNPYEITEEVKQQAMKDPKTKLLQLADAVRNAEEGTKEYNEALNSFQKERDKFIEDQGMDEYKKIMPDYPKGKSKKPAEKEDLHYSAKAEDHERNELVHKIKSYSKDIDTYEAKRAELERDGEKLARKDNLSKEEEKKLLQISKNRNTILQMIKERNAEVMEAKQKLAEYDERKRRAEEEKPAEKEDLQAALKEVENAIDNAGDYDDVQELEKERKQLLKKLGKKPVEKKKTFKQEMNELYDAQDKAWEGFESGSEIKSTPENSKKFYDRVKKFVDDNNIKLSKKHYDEIADGNGHSFNEALALAGAYGEENKKRALAKNRENAEKYKGAVLDLSMINEFKEKEEESDSEDIKRAKEKIKQYAGKKINSNEISDIKILDDGKRSGFLTFEFKSGNDKYKMTYDYGFGGEKGGVSIKKFESEESEAEKTQNRSDAMKGNQNARKFGADWEEKRKEIQSKLSANLDKMLEGHDKAKDVYEKLQSNLDKRKADAELYRKYLGNQEEPEDVKDFRKWCADVMEQYRKEVTNTPSKETITKWEETAKNTPTEKLEEVYNGKQKVDYSNEYENFIDSTIINEFSKDKDLIFPQPYTMLKDMATRKYDNSDKVRLEVIKKELDSRKKDNKNTNKGRVEDIQLKNGARLTSRDGNTYSFAKTSPDRKTSLFTEVKQDKRDGSFSVDYYTADSNGRIKYDAGEEGFETDFEDMNSLEEGLNKFFERNPKTENEKSSKEIKSKTDKTVQKIDSDSFTKIDNKTIEMPVDKTTRSIFETLNKSRSTDKARAFMTDCYYDGENIVSTDGKRMTVIKAENLDLEPGYVNVKTDGGKVTLERIEGKENKFPIYQRVIPQNNNQEVKLNNKVLRDKLKQLKKEGAYNNSYDSFNRVTLEFEDGKVLLDGTVVGTGNVKDNQDLNYRNFNGDYLLEALSDSDTTSMFLDEESMHPITIRTNISDTVIMPMTNDDKANYEVGREAKRKSNDAKAAKKEETRKYVKDIVDNIKVPTEQEMKKIADTLDSKMEGWSDDNLKKQYDTFNINFDKVYGMASIRHSESIVDKQSGASLERAYKYKLLNEKYPEVKERMAKELEKRGVSFKKSFFDDLFEIGIIEDDEIEEEDFEDNPLFNDYSAEQPELFNSTELMVSEAFNRCNCL